MKKHYIHELNRKELLDFLQDDNYKTFSDEYLRSTCIHQLLHDENAENYSFDKETRTLYVKETK